MASLVNLLHGNHEMMTSSAILIDSFIHLIDILVLISESYSSCDEILQ